MYPILLTATTPFDSVDFSTVTTYAEAIAGKALIPVITVLALTIGFKLLKKFGNKIG